MPLITFTSDFGLSDHYVAQTKAKILSTFPGAQIVDISHHVRVFNLAHLSYTIGSVFRDFPEGSIHLIGGDSFENQFLMATIEGHIIIAPDNGIISLLSEKQPDTVYRLKNEHHIGQITAEVAKGKEISAFGSPTTEYKQLMQRKPRATKKEISGHVIHVDHYGNLITNIDKTDFDILSKDRGFTLSFARERLQEVHQKISEVEPGDAFAVFTQNGYLMIGINQGRGHQLLGLEYDSVVTIQFEE